MSHKLIINKTWKKLNFLTDLNTNKWYKMQKLIDKWIAIACYIIDVII